MPQENKELKNQYDAVVIGAGIGGLTCGAFLAKKGLSVLISEQQSKPGATAHLSFATDSPLMSDLTSS